MALKLTGATVKDKALSDIKSFSWAGFENWPLNYLLSPGQWLLFQPPRARVVLHHLQAHMCLRLCLSPGGLSFHRVKQHQQKAKTLLCAAMALPQCPSQLGGDAPLPFIPPVAPCGHSIFSLSLHERSCCGTALCCHRAGLTHLCSRCCISWWGNRSWSGVGFSCQF